MWRIDIFIDEVSYFNSQLRNGRLTSVEWRAERLVTCPGEPGLVLGAHANGSAVRVDLARSGRIFACE
jgi:hypothetical protein